MSGNLSREQAVSVSRVSALVVINALIFQEILSNDDGRVQPLRRMLQRSDFVGAIEDQWRFILDEIDYFPIFDVASAYWFRCRAAVMQTALCGHLPKSRLASSANARHYAMTSWDVSTIVC